jgi:hypothetical protein
LNIATLKVFWSSAAAESGQRAKAQKKNPRKWLMFMIGNPRDAVA